MRWILRGVMLLSLIVAPWLSAEDEAPADSQVEADTASQNARAELALWTLTRGEDETPLKRTEKPSLRWSNPQVGRVYGDVYFFLQNGRPEAAVSIYRFFSPYQSLNGECVSLSDRPLTLKRESETVWSPRSGITFLPVSGAPAPAADRAARLRQMRTLAREFEAVLTDTRNKATGAPESLRLLPQPMFRYEDSEKRPADGSVFTFVVSTDPEAFLILESRATDGGQQRWEFALARMNRDAISVRHGGKEVWKVPEINGLDDPQANYHVLVLPNP
jgi:hypothetical protein